MTWLLLAAAPAKAAPIDLAGINAMLDLAQSRVSQALIDLAGDTTRFPHAHGESWPWKTVGADDWTSGFFPGTLWLLYQATGDVSWRAAAWRWTAPLASQATRTDTMISAS